MKAELISIEDFSRATHLERFRFASKTLMNLFKIDELNHLYAHAVGKEGHDFIADIFEQLQLSFDFNEEELKHIPKEGPFITISNHPFGAIDGLLLLFLLSKVRIDFKVIANFLLGHIKPIASSFITVNPFENRQELSSSYAGIRTALKHLHSGGGLGIFPAGQVSSFKGASFQIEDKRWNPSILKLIKKAEVPIVPIHFEGNNSTLFHLLGVIHPSLRTIALPSELIKKRNKKIRIRIGKAISISDQQQWSDANELGRFLRAKTYSLDYAIEVKKFFQPRLRFVKKENALSIASPLEKEMLENEIEQIKDLRIGQQLNFELYIAPAERIPNLLHEIGRQREITFRAVGEGTNKAIDLDEHDLYYHHLFLWDTTQKAIVGSYRLGKGKEILIKHGKKGFYCNSLFRFKKEFNPVLEQTIEMGRSFITSDYQQKRLPLFMLWKGIMHFVLSNPEYRYLLGPVSISNDYSRLSRMIIVRFIQAHYFNEKMAKWVAPRKKFKVKFKKIEAEKLLENTRNDLKKVDQLIADIEPAHHPLPVLIKKYLKQNARIISFNLDPKFNDALDGLMLLDLQDLDEKYIDDLKKDML
jgi:putative hemolysin